MVTYAMIAIFLPMAFPCTSSNCILDNEGAEGGGTIGGITGSEVAGTGGVFCEAGSSENIHRVVERSMEMFTCQTHWTMNDPGGALQLHHSLTPGSPRVDPA